MKERRSDARMPWSVSVHVFPSKDGTKSIGDVRLRNISRTGFGLLSEDKLIRGNVYRFEGVLNGTKLNLVGRVLHMRADTAYYVCGVRFEQMTFGDRGRLNHFLADHSQKLRTRFAALSLATGVGGFVVGLLLFKLSSAWAGIFGGVLAILAWIFLPF